MYLLIAFGLTFLLFAWLRYRHNKTSRGRYENLEAFNASEMESNFIRKKDIDPEYFVQADLARLPFTEPCTGGDPFRRLQENVKNAAGKKMLRLPRAMDNREVKLAFGTAHLELVTQYEENYHRFMIALLKWGEALLAAGERSGGEAVLKESVRLGSEFSKTYALLANLYIQNGEHEKLEQLHSRAASPDFLPNSPDARKTILQAIANAVANGGQP